MQTSANVSQDTPFENTRINAYAGRLAGHDVSAEPMSVRELGLDLAFRCASGCRVGVPFEVTRRAGYQGASTSTEIMLNAIVSGSYGDHSTRYCLLLYHCAELRKSPTIGQLRGKRLPSVDLARLLHLLNWADRGTKR